MTGGDPCSHEATDSGPDWDALVLERDALLVERDMLMAERDAALIRQQLASGRPVGVGSDTEERTSQESREIARLRMELRDACRARDRLARELDSRPLALEHVVKFRIRRYRSGLRKLAGSR